MKTNSSPLPANVLPAQVKQSTEELLRAKFGSAIRLEDFTISSGGCINHGGVLHTSAGKFFIKWNDAHQFPLMFQTEAKGLTLLSKANSIRVPEVIGLAEADSFQFIIIEFIDSKKNIKAFWQDLGHQLASLHLHTHQQFGLDHDNYIGSLRQSNLQNTSWIDFFIEQRLSWQLTLAETSGLVNHSLRMKFDALFKKLPELLTEEGPSLLHGDLWSGNLISDDKGRPCLIDPAVYFGNPEIELAFAKLFGGFGPEFYQAYHEIIRAKDGFEERMDVYNLYPLLVHTNLFGQTYLKQVEATLDRFM